MSATFKTKVKAKKNNKLDNRITLDARHEEKTKYFQDLKATIEPKQKMLTEYQKKINYYVPIPKKSLTQEQMNEYLELKDKVIELKKEIQEINENKEEIDYILNAGILVFQYYENKEKIAKGVKPTKQKKKKKYSEVNNNTKSILEILQSTSTSTSTSEKTTTESSIKEKVSTLTNNKTKKEQIEEVQPSIINLSNDGKYQSRDKIRNQYLSIVDNVYIKDEEENDDYDIFVCDVCGYEKFVVQSQAVLVCKECGDLSNILIDSEKPSYKDPPKEASYFAYKRINHFNEWLAQFQAKESTDIPDSVYDNILIEIKKERITNMASLDQKKLKAILKKLGLNKYYEHIPHIINRLNGIPAPVMSRETEEVLRSMFKEIQNPFIKHCPKDRKNFLSYSYVLHKFCQLLGLDEFLSCFPLLKSREKLHQQDLIWVKICKDLRWEFIKSL